MIWDCYRDLGEYEESATLEYQAIEIMTSLNSVDLLTQYLTDYAYCCSMLDDHKNAEWASKKAISIRRKNFPIDHPSILINFNTLAIVNEINGDYSKALLLKTQVLVSREKYFGSNHISVAHILNNLGVLYRKIENFSISKLLYSRALSIYQSQENPDYEMTAIIAHNLAIIYEILEDISQSHKYFSMSIDIMEKYYPSFHPNYISFLSSYSQFCYRSCREYHKAKVLLEKAIKISENKWGNDHAITQDLYLGYNNVKQLMKVTLD